MKPTRLTQAKRRYRIEGGNYGGEATLGTVPIEFVRHCEGMDENDLIGYIQQFDWIDTEPVDLNTPRLETTWHDYDDIVHLTNCYSDSEWTVYEVPTDGSDDRLNDKEIWRGKPFHLYGRECFHYNAIKNNPPEDMTNIIPVLAFHSSEKGNFGRYFLNIDDGVFIPEKLSISTVEMNLAEIVENVFYGRHKVEADHDFNDTIGKAYYASVGYLDKALIDQPSKYTIKYLEEEGYFFY